MARELRLEMAEVEGRLRGLQVTMFHDPKIDEHPCL